MLIEPAIYLAALLADVRAAGARIVETELSPAAVAALDEDVVVNCTAWAPRRSSATAIWCRSRAS